MDKFFDILFLDEAFEFLNSLDRKHYEKILYNIRKSQTEHDPELFKKPNDEIWEFRMYIRVCNTGSCVLGQDQHNRHFGGFNTRVCKKAQQSVR